MNLPVLNTNSLRILLILSLFSISCSILSSNQQINETTEIKNRHAEVVLFICSRGCYQYLLKIQSPNGEKYLFPDSLGKTFQKDKLNIVISGKITEINKQVYKTSETDKPLPDFVAPLFILDSIYVIEK